jgi:hypothetical protein
MQGRIILLGLALAGLPSAAMANVIFPALIVTGRMLAWWVIVVSLVIELLFVKAAFRLSTTNAAFATLGANGLSAALGLFAIPYLGMFFEFGLYHAGIADRVGWDTFGLAAWIVAFLLAVAFNLAIEIPVYRFGYGLKVWRREFLLIALANAITAGLACASLAFIPYEY